jgi:hypothetical protein
MKHELEKIVWGIIPITVYRGCIVEKLIGGYKVFNTKCLTCKEVDNIIDNSEISLQKSILA